MTSAARRCLTVSLFVGLVLAGAMCAADEAPRLVALPLVVSSERGGDPDGLEAGELRLEIGGERRAFQFLRRFGFDAHDVTGGTGRLFVDAGPSGGVASAHTRAPRYWMLFLDLENTGRRDLKRWQKQLETYFASPLASGERVAVVSFSGSLQLETPYTSAPDEILAALHDAFERPRALSETGRDRSRRLTRVLRECRYVSDNPFLSGKSEQDSWSGAETGQVADEACLRPLAFGFVREARGRAQRYYDALDTALRLAGTVRGGSEVVLLSPGVPTRPADELLPPFVRLYGNGQVGKLPPSALDADERGLFRAVAERALAERVRVHLLGLHRRGGSSAASDAGYRAISGLARASGGVVERVGGLDIQLGAWRARRHVNYELYYFDAEVPSARRAHSVSATRAGVSAQAGWPREELFASRSERERARIRLGESSARRDGSEGAYVPFWLDVVLDGADYAGALGSGDGLEASDLALHLQLIRDDEVLVTDLYRFFRHSRESSETRTVLSLRGYVEVEPGRYRLSARLSVPRSETRVSASAPLELVQRAAAAR